MNSLGRAGAIAAIVLTATSSLAAASAPVGAAPAPPKRPAAAKVVGRVPSPVTSHAVAARRPHDSDAVLALNLGLAVHHSAELDEVIRAASTPGSPSYGRYLTQAQYKARYAPTDAEVADVRAWLTANGLRVTGVSPSNLIVSAEATTAVAERAFGVTINDYIGERTFYANNVAPSVPADSSVRWVTGLDDSLEVKSFIEPAFRSGGYFPGDFQKGYHTGNATTTESIGFTLWGAPLPQSDFTQFATNTGSPAVVVNGVGANGINFIPCSTSSCNPAGTHSTNESVWAETALDVQSAHGVAPGSHMKYWLASTSSGGDPLQAALENALDAAANDSTVKVVSNSWGINLDIHIPTMDASLQHAAAVGKTFFFSSDDTADISYPATSPYVVSVGGTNLNLDGGFNYVSESAWNGSGTGCSEVFGRPSWQVGVGTFATCDGRAEPDVAADADPFTGAYTYYDGGSAQIGGTSLAAPLWAGMTAVWNQANITAGKPVVGFAAPLLYALGNNKTIYHDIFHDVTTGSAGGNPAGAGWDQVTGWGSPDLVNLIAASQGLASTSTTLVTSQEPEHRGRHRRVLRDRVSDSERRHRHVPPGLEVDQRLRRQTARRGRPRELFDQVQQGRELQDPGDLQRQRRLLGRAEQHHRPEDQCRAAAGADRGVLDGRSYRRRLRLRFGEVVRQREHAERVAVRADAITQGLLDREPCRTGLRVRRRARLRQRGHPPARRVGFEPLGDAFRARLLVVHEQGPRAHPSATRTSTATSGTRCSTGPSSGRSRRRRVTATTWSPPTAASSASATRASTARPATCT